MQRKGVTIYAKYKVNYSIKRSSSFMNITVLAFLQLGANAILAVSLAVCKAGAAVRNVPLYKVYRESLLVRVSDFPSSCLLYIRQKMFTLIFCACEE